MFHNKKSIMSEEEKQQEKERKIAVQETKGEVKKY